VTSIGDGAFDGCKGLKSVTIPNSVTSIEYYAFSDCSGLETIKVEAGNTKYDSRDNCNAIIETNTNTLVAGCKNTIIPNSVTSIRDGAFDGCKGLKSVTIPNGVTSIGNNAFDGCKGLKSVTIPNSVTSIEYYAFSSCSGLKNVKMCAETPLSITYDVFSNLNLSKMTLYVPKGSRKLYTAAKVWKEFGKIVEDPDTDISAFDNIVYMNRQEAYSGIRTILSLRMKNTAEMVGFQADLYLPNGVTVAKDDDDMPLIELSGERTTAKKTDFLNSAVQADGSTRILCSSTKGYAFSGNDGEVVTVTVNIPETMKEGDYPIVLKNIELSDKSSGVSKVPYFKTTLTVSSLILGDANGSGDVTVSDFTATANHILGATPKGFDLKAADVNQDRNISVGDLTGIANIILYGSPTGPARSRDYAASNPVVNVEVLPFTLGKGGESRVAVAIRNSGATFSAYQFDVRLPEGVTLKDAALGTDRTSAQASDFFSWRRLDDGAYRVLCASTSGALFSGGEGAVAILTLSAEKDMPEGTYDMEISDIEVSRDARVIKPADVMMNFNVGGATGIGGNGVEGDIHDLNGISRNGIQKGINIIDNKKILK